jgi:hypothetical protein
MSFEFPNTFSTRFFFVFGRPVQFFFLFFYAKEMHVTELKYIMLIR